MPLDHLSRRSLRRRLQRAERQWGRAYEGEEECGMWSAPRPIEWHARRVEELGAALASRPDPKHPKHPWTLKPGETIRVWLESHGIGPNLAQRAKWQRRKSRGDWGARG